MNIESLFGVLVQRDLGYLERFISSLYNAILDIGRCSLASFTLPSWILEDVDWFFVQRHLGYWERFIGSFTPPSWILGDVHWFLVLCRTPPSWILGDVHWFLVHRHLGYWEMFIGFLVHRHLGYWEMFIGFLVHRHLGYWEMFIGFLYTAILDIGKCSLVLCTAPSWMLLAFMCPQLENVEFPSKPQPTVSVLWQIPQYVVITGGEILFSISALQFAYSQVGNNWSVILFFVLTFRY